mmetsp:Transcript_43718/g.50561  ORF Transcript_43718/g.50561 Transcript_43718/m.50561 type:complete len:259 (-) Transcript_43718:76-852(-)
MSIRRRALWTEMQSMVLLASLALLFFCSCAVAIKTRIAPGTLECYHIEVEPGASASFSFEVVHGGQKDLDVTLTATSVEAAHHAAGANAAVTSLNHRVTTKEVDRFPLASSGRSVFTAASAAASGADGESAAHGFPTRLSACFNNKMSKWTPKWFEFQLFTDPLDPALDPAVLKEHYASAETELEHSLHREGNNLFHVRNTMQKLKQLEMEHRDKVESTGEWTLYGTIFNGALLMVLSIFQYWHLTKFLSVRNASMRL